MWGGLAGPSTVKGDLGFSDLAFRAVEDNAMLALLSAKASRCDSHVLQGCGHRCIYHCE